MRKTQKQEALNFVNVLYQALEELKDALGKKQTVLVQDILSICQEAAIEFGTYIETVEGEGHVTVSYIEAYCEILFYIFEAVANGDINEKAVCKKIYRQLIKIEGSIQNDILVRKEVVFFPYKASMWDSLESVYLSAREDPNCDAYCVPIPYYDLNSDQSFGQMHYEGMEYPKNIEVTDWMHYDLEERKPDVVFIHNPYDKGNLVTSVHPRYYSDNLKKYADKLVYIPYFILQEIEPDDQATIDGIKHFCFASGIINADKVIVQSEKMKQIYINEYLKAAKEYGLGGFHTDRGYLGQKFLGLGSPKIDKVINTKKEDIDLPLDWLEKIQKADGSWKKIILYNTGVSALLMHSEKWIDKIEAVLKVFKKKKDIVTLLWRPHPLVENTIKSMRPQMLWKYLHIKDRFINEGWGIFDDTADMDRAVLLSDAYYGDASSMVQIYQQTGKPVMMQKSEIIDNENI